MQLRSRLKAPPADTTEKEQARRQGCAAQPCCSKQLADLLHSRQALQNIVNDWYLQRSKPKEKSVSSATIRQAGT